MKITRIKIRRAGRPAVFGLLMILCHCGMAQTFSELTAQVNKLMSDGNNQAALPIALRAKDSALRIYGDTADDYAGALYNLANVYMNLGNYTAAEPLFVKVCAIEKPLLGETDTAYAVMLNSLGLNYANMGKFRQAEGPWRQALAIRVAQFGEANPLTLTSMENIGGLYMNIGKLDSAEVVMKRCVALRKQFNGDQSPEYANVLNGLGVLYFYKGKYTTAEPIYQEAAAINKKIFGEVSYEYSMSLNNLGDVYNSMALYSPALETQKKVLEIRRKLNGEDNAEYAQSLTQLALVYFNLGNYAAAEPLYLQALPLRKKWTGEGVDYTYTLNNLAALYMRRGDFARAEPLFRKSVEIRKREEGDHSINLAWSLGNLAALYEDMGNFAEARPMRMESLAIFRETEGEKSPDYAMELDELARLYQSLHEYDSAMPLFRQALEIRKTVLGEKNIFYSQSLHNLAALYNDMGRVQESKSMYEQSLVITGNALGKENTDYATGLNNLGQTHYRLGDYAVSDSLFRVALGIIRRNLGENIPMYAHDLNNLAAVYVKTGQYDSAEKAILRCGQILTDNFHANFLELSEGEKLKWWANETSYFEMAPSLLAIHPGVSPEFLRQACMQQLLLKGFILEDGTAVLAKARRSADPEMRGMLDQWQGNKATLARQYALPVTHRIRQLDSLEKATNLLEKEINTRSAAFRQGVQNESIGFEQVRHRLKPGEAAVEYVRFTKRYGDVDDPVSYGAFIILPDHASPRYVSLCGERQLTALLDSRKQSSAQFVNQLYRGTHVTNDDQTAGKRGDSLYKLVWKPLLPWLKGVKKVDVAPAGLLDRIAFNALPAGKDIVLIDQYQLRYYTSVRQLAEDAVSVSAQGSSAAAASVSQDSIVAVLYGGIRFDGGNLDGATRGEGWPPLPGTLQEVDQIGELFRVNHRTVRVVSGESATEESFKALSGHSPSVLHLATHGFALPDSGSAAVTQGGSSALSANSFVMSENPLLRSGFIMAGANRVWEGGAPQPGKEDGIVTAYEIASLDLGHTDLLVLSACETALGDIRGTEGVFGLQRAFKLAGVKNMLLSLWQVPDEETADLMRRMYASKLRGMSTYNAFYSAQREMRKKYPPYYWAAFVLIE